MIDVLRKSDNKSTKSLSTIPKYNATKGIIKKIFESLRADTEEYNPTSTIKIIDGYINEPEKWTEFYTLLSVLMCSLLMLR